MTAIASLYSLRASNFRCFQRNVSAVSDAVSEIFRRCHMLAAISKLCAKPNAFFLPIDAGTNLGVWCYQAICTGYTPVPPYTVSGTGTAYGAVRLYARATQCPVLTSRTVVYVPTHALGGVRY
eukprot:1021313-Rhodomonas_salina.2